MQKNECGIIKGGVTHNPRTPSDVLKEMVNNKDEYILYSIAKNKNTPIEALEILMDKKIRYIRYYVAMNPNASIDMLKDLSNDISWDVRRHVAANLKTPVKILSKLANDKNSDVRSAVAGNPNTPQELLSKLSDDKISKVVKAVRNRSFEPKIDREVFIGKNYVSIQGTSHRWFKFYFPDSKPIYQCGCFCGNREQLLSRICCITEPEMISPRLSILKELDKKFD